MPNVARFSVPWSFPATDYAFDMCRSGPVSMLSVLSSMCFWTMR